MKKTIVMLLISIFIFLNKAKAEGGEIVGFVYGTSVLIGLNVGTSIANINYIKEQNVRLKPLQISGIITGTTQTLLGVVCILSLDPEYIVLGSINAGFGLAATIISIASINKNNHLLHLNKTTAWNIKSIPLGNGSMGICFSIKQNL
ncbi:MAG: hypothetical protein RL708_1628 [Bacteroidota bacterium]|jgi:hypothetical protein